MPSNTTNTASIIERKKTELQQHLDTIKKAVDIQHSTSKGPMSSTQKRKNSVDDDEYVDSNTKRTKVLKRNRRTSPIVTRRKSVTEIDSPPLSESDPQEEIEEEVVASDQEPEDEEPRIRRKRREPFDLENLDPEMRKCYKLLHEFLSHKNSWPFREPVDPEALGVPNYFDIIQHPMDLSTIDTKLVNNEYKTTEDFANDMRLVWNNAITFNTPGDFYYKTAQKFSQMFEKKWGIATATSKPFIPTSNRRGRKKVEPATYPNFTFQDKANLADQIRQMSVEELGKVLQIIKQSRGTILETNDELELDVDAMDNATLYRLLKFAEICTQKRGNAPTSKVVSPPTTASTTTSV